MTIRKKQSSFPKLVLIDQKFMRIQTHIWELVVGIIVTRSNFFVRFLEELRRKSPFEIN